MIIESVDSLKTWLVKELEPICDADPAALAKYVIALVKKEKSEADLKALCEDQLDVFLGEETRQFVGNLFKALGDNSYLPPAPLLTQPTVEEPIKEVEQKGTKRKSFEETPKDDFEKLAKTEKNTDVGKVVSDKENIDNVDNSNNDGSKNENNISEGNATENNRLQVERSDDVRMRSVSKDRSMKSMSPRARHRTRRSSRSPNRSSRHSRHMPSGSGSSRSSRSDKSRDSRSNRDNGRRTKSSRREATRERCRDYEEKGYCMLGETCRFDHGRDPVEVDDRNLPHMLSLATANTFPPSSQPNNAATMANPSVPVFQNVIGQRPMVAPIGTANLNTSLTTVQAQNTRPSPVEINTQVPIFRPRNPMALFRNISPTGVPPAIPGQPTPPQAAIPHQQPPISETYNPEQPSILETDEVLKETKISVDKVKEDEDRSQDELVQIAMGNVPLTPILGQQPTFPINCAQTMNFPDLIQPQHIMRPAEPMKQVVRVTGNKPYHGGKNTCLEIRKIPGELNNMVKLSEHFQKFGTITKLQSPFDADPQGALIEFATNREAYAAYSSPEAILGNRFIKMFWHKPAKDANNPHNGGKDNVRGIGATSTASEIKTETSAPLPPPEPKKVAKAGELYFRNPKSDPKLIQMEKKKELEQLKNELRKKKQKSYEDLVEKQKQILSKLQEKGLSKEEKTKLMKTFSTCDTTIKKLKQEIQEETVQARAAQNLHQAKPYKNTKKEILDKEIDIIHGNLQGEELVEAKKDLEMLKEEMGYDPSVRGGRGGYRGRGRGGAWWKTRGRGRGSARAMSTVDNRPKKILVAGYTVDEKDSVLAHFNTISHVDQIEEISTEKMVITFPNRKGAEIAAIQGIDFNGKQLQLSWFTGQINKPTNTSTTGATDRPKIQRRMTRSLSQSLMEKDLEDDLLEDVDKEEEDMLLAGVDDEDDEDDTESITDRSWKR